MSIGLNAPLIPVPVCTVTTGEAIFHENEQMIVHFVISSSNITFRIRIMYGNKFTFIYLSYLKDILS
jgi:hypothetical protein